MFRGFASVFGAISVAVGLGFASPADAVTVNGATQIDITSASLTYIQIAEVIATQAGTGTDVALAANGGTATALNQYCGTCGPGDAIDGVYPRSYYDTPGIYTSAGTANDYLDIFLANPTNLASLTIYGREDCCQERDVFNVKILDSNSVVLYSGRIDTSAVDASGGGVTVNFDVAATPLPATWTMMLIGLAGLGFFGYRGTKKRTVLAVA
jgi:hypothetical protein